MLDKFKAMGAMAALMKDKERLREASQRVQRRAEEARVEGQAGAGAVRAVCNAKLRVLEIEVSPALLSAGADDDARHMAQDLIAQATNDAMERAQRVMQEIIREEATELGLEDLAGDLSGLLS